MREFYCPGSFTFDKSKNPFLVYTCSWLKSEDSFTSAKKFIEAKKSFNIKKEKNLIYISFILPISEMRKANGYFDYSGKDKKFLEGKNWLNKTVVTLENK